MRAKSALQGGKWPEVRASAHEVVGLTAPARKQAEATIAMLEGHGVEVRLDGDKIKFKSRKTPPLEARRAIEVQGDLLEAWLRERG